MNIEIPLKTSIKGHFKLEAVDMLTGKKRFLAEFDNLVTDQGLDRMATDSDWLSYCSVGSGNTAPANTDTGLVSFVSSTSTRSTSNSGNSGSSPWFAFATITYRFAIGTAAGNLSEIGIGWSNTNGHLFSRALILDGSGNPTTITILSSEALDATYTFQLYAPLVDVTGSVTINGVATAYTFRASSANGGAWAGGFISGDNFGYNGLIVYNGSIGSITGAPGGSSDASNSSVVQSYSSGSYQLDTIFSWGLTQGNLSGGITAILIYAGQQRQQMGQFQVGFSPAIPKDGTKTMTLTFRQSWARH